jgi:type II secretory pathway pseudopilin PulG
VVVILAILAALMLPVAAKLRARAQRAQCAANLKSLHVAAQLYTQEHNMWPQVTMDASADEPWTGFAQQWIAALKPYGTTAKTWICPTLQNSRGDPDYTTPGNERVDYIGTPFDDKPVTPYTVGRVVPWFSESQDEHGNGNLVIFADGSVDDVKTVAAKASPSPGPP